MNDEKKKHQNCPYNGQTEEECQCDECDHFLECFPEYDMAERKSNAAKQWKLSETCFSID